MKLVTKSFKGLNVFLSRNLVTPDIFDAVHDSLKQNGAEIFLCCDPSRSGIDDYHVISSPTHEKYGDLIAKGCNLVGPQCVLFCAKENRALPKHKGFICCLAMEGVKILSSGFKEDDKIRIEKIVTAMGGVYQTRTSQDISFVIVNNVLAGKYKWALNSLKKPIVTIGWLYKCWTEHRIVPQEPYKVLPFSGLTICITGIPVDVRKEMQRIIEKNGGRYSGNLTRACTHLICDAPQGDKYIVARKWGHIHIVTKKWLEQSVARKACLGEESYLVQEGSVSSSGILKHGLKGTHNQDKGNIRNPESVASLRTELEPTLTQNISSTVSESTTLASKHEGTEAPILMPGEETKSDSNFVADDSQNEDNDLYLSDCRILLVGFHVTEMRKLVNMVRKGGGSRYMSFSEKLTHIVIGTPSENERKEIRRYAASGVIYVVRTVWLQDCEREKKEVPVSQRHIVSDLFTRQDPVCFTKTPVKSISGIKQEKSLIVASSMLAGEVAMEEMTYQTGMSLEKIGEQKPATTMKVDTSANRSSTNVFKGRFFRFSSYFPPDRRAEIVEWINQGGGALVDDRTSQNLHFTIESHGLFRRPAVASQTTIVSTHWIRSCLEDGCMPDVSSNIIYSPLPCRVPLPGFESFRFCVSQYEEKEKQLIRNLCFVLGAKFTEILSGKVTHLLCKFTSGPKYEAACKWGIQTVTSEWISECIRQDTITSINSFRPKEVTAQDREAGLCTMTQFNTQAAKMVSGDIPSQLPTQSQASTDLTTQSVNKRDHNLSKAKQSSASIKKRLKLSNDGKLKDSILPDNGQKVSVCKIDSLKSNMSKVVQEVSHDGSDHLRDSTPPDIRGNISVCKMDFAKVSASEVVQEVSQLPTQSQTSTELTTRSVNKRDHSLSKAKQSSASIKKRLKLSNDGKHKVSVCKMDSLKSNMLEVVPEVSYDVPDPSRDSIPPYISGNVLVCKLDSVEASALKVVQEVSHDHLRDSTPPDIRENISGCKINSAKASTSEVVQEVSHDIPDPDVATVIEDLLAQSSKIQDMTSQGRTEPDRNILPPDHSVLVQNHAGSRSAVGTSNHWLSRNQKQDGHCNNSIQDGKGVTCDGFSETQTESQVVVYEQDLSGIQMMLDRARTRSSLT